MARRQEIFTLGHSTRSLDEVVKILRAYGVRRLVDVRTIPRSRHNPQFNKETLGKYLRNRRISYRHMKALGGLRRALVDSVNQGFRNKSFRGFADYMQTPAFEAGIRKLLDLAAKKPTVIVCAEAVPPFPYRGRSHGTERPRRAHFQRDQLAASRPDLVRQG